MLGPKPAVSPSVGQQDAAKYLAGFPHVSIFLLQHILKTDARLWPRISLLTIYLDWAAHRGEPLLIWRIKNKILLLIPLLPPPPCNSSCFFSVRKENQKTKTQELSFHHKTKNGFQKISEMPHQKKSSKQASKEASTVLLRENANKLVRGGIQELKSLEGSHDERLDHGSLGLICGDRVDC